ncbi:MAG: hypothetical protein RI601_12620, partial [Desulfurivibrionaceae bacterium]|nr:hypothetical protein [Desulfurivibrionaceae bacterium]
MESEWKITYVQEAPIVIGDGNYSSKYPKAKEFLSNGVPFISASDMSDGAIRSDNFRFISHEQHATLTKGHLLAGDVLV